MAANVLRRPLVGNARATLAGFREQPMRQHSTGQVIAARIFTSDKAVFFIISALDGSDAAAVATTCIGLCKDEAVEHYQLCAFYMCALATLMPSVLPVARNVMRNMGLTIREIRMNQIGELGAEEPDEIPDTLNLTVMIGQLVFLLYMNINPSSYDTYMIKRVTDMKAMVGIYGSLYADSDATEVVLAVEKAGRIRQTLGAQHELRNIVLESMIITANQAAHPASRMFSYICNMLNWTEMSSILFICQTLCQTKSPVLRDIRVRDEVENLYYAFQAIMGTQNPQYFRIQQRYQVANVIEKSKFPILTAVSKVIRVAQQPSANNFIASLSSENPVVKDLVIMHTAYMAGFVRQEDRTLPTSVTFTALRT